MGADDDAPRTAVADKQNPGNNITGLFRTPSFERSSAPATRKYATELGDRLRNDEANKDKVVDFVTVAEHMRRTGMDQFVAAHPKGLARPIAEGGKGLSGGQKQLVAFTRLVLCNPHILLLDEPTATMDEEQERRCLTVLHQESQKRKTLVIVTHKPNVLSLVERIVVVVANQILLDGPRDTVLQQLKQRTAAAAAAAAAPAAANPNPIVPQT
jgi:ABC-type protease/lipase transport system fused ATPase/permease subunit